jgi:urea carboxylase
VGQQVQAGDKVVVLDAMKTELVVTATAGGTIEQIFCKPGALINAGQPLLLIRTE